MTKVACSISMALDAFVAGPNMTVEKPFGDMPEDALHHWMFDEPEKHRTELDALTDAGAFIMGSNMYGPKDRRERAETWKGWWGDNPPYHAPVFVLTNTPRESIAMEGGTTFHFVTGGIEVALARAQEAAGDKTIAIAGGAQTVNQFLAAGLIDELWLHLVPITLGKGARLFEGVPNLEMEPISTSGSKLVTHIKYRVIKK